MDLKSRQIEFVQEFLKVQNEKVIARLERLLHKESEITKIKDFESLTEDELNSRIDQSE